MTKHTPYQPGDIVRSANTNDDIDGLSTGENDTANNSLQLFRQEMFEDAFVRGTMKWSKVSGLVGTMTLGVYYLRGVRYEANGISSYAFQDNSDTYVTFNEGGQMQVVVKQNGAEAPTKPVDKITNAIVTTVNGQITNIIQTGVDSNSDYVYNTGLIGRNTGSYDLGQAIGSTMMWAGPLNTIPAGWVVRDGSALSRTQYAALFKILGSLWGGGNGTTTFNLPNDLGRVDVGLDTGQTEFDTIGKRAGAKTHTLSWNEMPVHNHGVYDPGHSHGASPQVWRDAGGGGTYNMTAGGNRYAQGLTTISIGGSGTGISIYNAGGGGAHNNLQPYSVKLPIIKAY